uniref:G-protein coupled receptors family 1 profile domain-containing protein n=1 Tax=Mastacembelus armatus TaxID=205130 RepID=A0A3Q3N7V5_9TELE
SAMTETLSASVSLGQNITFVRPTYFIIGGFIGIPNINGFSNIPHITYFLIFLCFAYIMTVVGNVFLMSVIYLVKTLHTPKYMIVFNLALADLCGSTALTPKLFETFLFDRTDIVYEDCLSYMFFVYLFIDVQSWTLVIMAYDRFIAICFPLRYHSIVTKPAIAAMLLLVWVVLLSITACTVGLFDRHSFCGSLVIQSFFCDMGMMLYLACDDISLIIKITLVSFVLNPCLPAILIILTYICIAIALSRIASRKERLKAAKTCTSHLILVAVYFIPLLYINLISDVDVDRDGKIICEVLPHIVPPLLNPILYSLKTQEVLNCIKRLCNNMLSNISMSKKVFTAMLTKWKVLK